MSFELEIKNGFSGDFVAQLHVTLDTYVADVKHALASRISWPAMYQDLLLEGSCDALHDTDVLIDAGIVPGSALLLMRRAVKETLLDGCQYHSGSEIGSEIVRYWLAKGANPNERHHRNNSPALRLAADANNLEAMQLLLQARAGVNLSDTSGRSALHEVAETNSTTTTQLLLEARAMPNNGDANGFTPLHIAAQHGNSEIVELLLNAKGDINKEEKSGNSVWWLAAAQNHADLFRWFAQLGANLHTETENGWRPLHRASFKGDSSMVALLLEAGANIFTRTRAGSQPLHLAGSADSAKLLIEARANPNETTGTEGKTPLHLISNTEVINVLIGSGAKLNTKDPSGITPLEHHFRNGCDTHRDAIMALLAAKADLQSTGNKLNSDLLHWAAASDDCEMTRLLVQSRIDIRPVDTRTGRTPLHAAAAGGRVDVVEALLAGSADSSVNAVDNQMWTPLHHAAVFGNAELCTLLIAHRADVQGWGTWRTKGSQLTPLDVVRRLSESNATRDTSSKYQAVMDVLSVPSNDAPLHRMRTGRLEASVNCGGRTARRFPSPRTLKLAGQKMVS